MFNIQISTELVNNLIFYISFYGTGPEYCNRVNEISGDVQFAGSIDLVV
jgi:hypothetical protein